jgi:O-antigen/teichoic acid export membrane protein
VTESRSNGLAWRTLKNSIYGLLEFGWPVFLSLLTAPYIVHRLGSDVYGVLSIVGVALGFFGFLDFGIGAAATRQIAALYEQEDHAGINTVVSTALVFYLGVGVIGAGLVLATTNVLVTRVLAIPPQLVHSAQLAFFMSAPGFLIALVLSTFGGIPRAIQRFDVSVKVNLALGTANTVAVVGLLWLGKGLLAVVAAGIVLNLVALPIMFIVSRRLVPTLKVQMAFDPRVFRDLFSFGGYFLLSSVGVMLLYQLDKLLVGSMLGVAAVTYYVVPGNLAQKIQQLVAAATAIAFPVSSALFASGARDALERLYRDGTRLVLVLIATIAVPLAVFSDKFLLYWMGGEIAREGSLAMVLLVGTYAMLASSAMAWGMANGSGHSGINAAFTLGITAIDIGLFFVLVRPFGVAGAAAAYFVSALVGVPVLVWYIERRIMGLSGWVSLRLLGPIAAVAAVQTAIAFGLRLLAWNLATVLAVMVLTALVFPLLYWASGQPSDSDRRLISLLVQRARGGSSASPPTQQMDSET